MRPTTWLVGLAVALAAAPARGAPQGGLGFDLMSMGLSAGVLDQRGTLPEAVEPSMPGPAFTGRGAMTVFRIRIAGLSAKPHTRFGSLAGIEAALGAGWMSRSAIRHDQGTDGIPIGPVFLDVDASLLVAPIHRERWRLAVAGGIGLSTERATWIIGPRFHYKWRKRHLAVRADYRPGRAWKGYESREARLGIDLGIATRHDSGFAIGVEAWLGQTVTDADLAPRDRALRGNYLAVLGSIERRW